MTILIPAFNPHERLPELVSRLKELEFAILIVDDGSSPQAKPIFDRCSGNGCTILKHPLNMGKGCALKTGIRYLMDRGEDDGIVCADADGQHLPEDILKIAGQVRKTPEAVILGSRRFTGKIPWKSRLGNEMTKQFFYLASGQKLLDTQTGLRGYSASFFRWLCQIPGNRFEYEINVLLNAVKDGYNIREVEIETVYPEGRHRTTFRPFIDSVRVYLPIIKFSMSSILSALVDFIFLLLFSRITDNLLISVAGARCISTALNYILNRQFVFAAESKVKGSKSLSKYILLAVSILLANYCIIFSYHKLLGVSLIPAKLLTEASIYLFSFWAQRKYVFQNHCEGFKIPSSK